MKSTDTLLDAEPDDDSVAPSGYTQDSGESSALPPVERELGYILDEENEEKVAKFIVKLREDQSAPRNRRRALAKACRAWRAGQRWVRLEKSQDQNLWRVYFPPGTASAPPTPNKTDRLCRRLVNTILVDKPYPECEPAGNDNEDKDAAEFATQYLAVKGAPSELNMNREIRAAMDKGMTYGSAFGWVTMDPHAGGHRPRSLLAHPMAEHADDALTDPQTGAAAPEEALTERYQRPDGYLTDDPADADWQWMPSPKIRRLTPLQLDLLPSTATGIADADGVVLAYLTSLGDLQTAFPETIDKLTDAQLEKLCTYRPSKMEDILPPFTKEPEHQKYKSGPKDGQYMPSQMVIAHVCYYRSCAEYPLGAYALVGGDSLVLHRQKWTALMPQPRGVDGKEPPPKEECLDLPVAQCRSLDDDVNDDPMGVPLVEKLGPSDEIRASAFAYEMEHMFRFANPNVFLPVGSIVQPGQLRLHNNEAVYVNPQGAPFYEPVPPLSPTIPELRVEMTAEMDDESGLQQAAQGVEDPSVKSGIHAQTIVQEALKAVTNLKDNAGDYYIRLNQIVLQLTRAYCTVPQLMKFKGKDGEFKAKEFARTDFRNTRVVTIARGSFTMHTLLAKQEAANNALQNGAIDIEEYKELTGGNVSPVIAQQENPHLLRIRRQVDIWRDGMPPEWPQAMQQYQLQLQEFQLVQQQQQMAQQQAAQLQQQGIPVPAPQTAPMQPPPKPPGPFDPRLPIDDEPMAAKIRHRELAKLMASTKFETQPPEWQQVLLETYALDKNAAGIMTVPDVQAQKAAEAANAPPALPEGVSIALKADASNVAETEQAALSGFQGGPVEMTHERDGAGDLTKTKTRAHAPTMETVHERDHTGAIVRSLTRQAQE
jgi:hypothetical protein